MKEKMLRDIVEAAGECWHECKLSDGSLCYKCGHRAVDSYLYDSVYACDDNPSHADMDELFRLAKKLNYHLELDVDGNGQTQLSVHRDNLLSIRPVAQSLEGLQLAEALLHALHKSLPEKE